MREEGLDRFYAKDYDQAIEKFKDAIRMLSPLRVPGEVVMPLYLPSSDTQPGTDTYRTRYIDLDYWRRFAVMGCCNEIAQCYLKMNDEIQVSFASVVRRAVRALTRVSRLSVGSRRVIISSSQLQLHPKLLCLVRVLLVRLNG